MHATSHHRHHRSPGSESSTSEITGWVSGALPSGLFAAPPTIEVDPDEILVVGDVGAPEVPEGLDAEGRQAAERARIARFREETRDQRIAVARQAEARYGRPISWGARAGATTERFTTVHARTATRLDFEQRKLLDALVAAGVAKNRPHALAWCVDLVRQNEEEWLTRLQEALTTLNQTAQDAPAARKAEPADE